jgi:Transposase, Mutator family
MQAALEAEVTEFPGRDRDQRAAACEDSRPGSRNGYREVTVKTTAGPVALARPKLRGTSAAFASRLFGSHVTKTNALESLVIASFVRGLSVRDVEAALAEALGDQAAISKSTVSSVCGQIKEEYQAWARRRLDEVTLDYLFLDASFFRMHPGSPAEPVLAAWGITTDGKPAFIGLAPGTGGQRVLVTSCTRPPGRCTRPPGRLHNRDLGVGRAGPAGLPEPSSMPEDTSWPDTRARYGHWSRATGRSTLCSHRRGLNAD